MHNQPENMKGAMITVDGKQRQRTNGPGGISSRRPTGDCREARRVDYEFYRGKQGFAPHGGSAGCRPAHSAQRPLRAGAWHSGQCAGWRRDRRLTRRAHGPAHLQPLWGERASNRRGACSIGCADLRCSGRGRALLYVCGDDGLCARGCC